MITRNLQEVATASAWGRQMRFIAGPRQSGKTTLAKNHLKKTTSLPFYYNWDKREIRSKHNEGIDLIKERMVEDSRKSSVWVCFDEIHKMPKWKNILKSYFDDYENKIRFLITGSARLDLFRKSGDSLAGRYFLFRLFPLTLFEITRKTSSKLPSPSSSANAFVQDRIANFQKNDASAIEALLNYGGFPEPFLKSSLPFLKRWQQDSFDRLVREDLRDLTRIADLENAAHTLSLLPTKVGSPLSVNSLRNDLQVSHETICNYLRVLKLCYAIFELPSYSKKIYRSIKKEKKVYLFDWLRNRNEGTRFENYVACELLSLAALWSDQGLADFKLHYVRNRSGQECDFLITKDQKPWILFEVKLKDQRLPPHLYLFSQRLGDIPIVQVVREEGVLHVGKNNAFRVSASRFFSA